LFKHATTNAGRIGLWVNASDPSSLRAGMLAVAADRGATDAELVSAHRGLRPPADLVWQYLDRSTEPWLLVLDNADTPAILRDGSWIRTSPAGTVVITSRRAGAHWWPGAELLHFGVLPREAAAQVLRDLAPQRGVHRRCRRCRRSPWPTATCSHPGRRVPRGPAHRAHDPLRLPSSARQRYDRPH
jgi:hypothetical protein